MRHVNIVCAVLAAALAFAPGARAESPAAASSDQSERVAKFLDVFNQACLHTDLEVEPIQAVMTKFQSQKYRSDALTKPDQSGTTLAETWMIGPPDDITLVLMREFQPKEERPSVRICSLEMQGPENLNITEPVEQLLKQYAPEADGALRTLIVPPPGDRPISGRVYFLMSMGAVATYSLEKRIGEAPIYRINIRLMR